MSTAEKCDELYQKALLAAVASAEGKTKIFTQEELLALGTLTEKGDLLLVLQSLADDKLVRLLHLEGKVLCSLRTRELAEKLRRLNGEEEMVYSHVENAGTHGVWTKNLKIKTGLVQTSINKVIKSLEGKVLIKSVKNIKNPTQKSYILAHLDPGEDVRGGPWHTDGELDMEMIGVTADIIVRFIESKSWVKGHIKTRRARSANGLQMIAATSRICILIETQVAHPPGYEHYPTVQTVLAFVQQSGFLKDSTSLKQEDIQGLLDVLVLDGRLEKVGLLGYRTIKGVKGASEAMKNAYAGRSIEDTGDDGEGTGLTQAPCGRCPVYNLCQEGGPVNPGNCEYFEVWLKA
ncbi:hypothetical protein ANO11243_033940 [Dothideomycetidae sp. 11243]|nr:hypothetical protein ANO11243_033940 [fungal sp. No.11243]